MEQFSLDKWLKDKSRKVCKRNGNIAEIIYTNGKGAYPVIVIDPYEEETEPWQVTENGKFFLNGDDDEYDLFFADEEDGLTEFEDKLLAFALMFSANIEEEKIEYVKESSKTLLDLARKELEANYYTKVVDDRIVLKSDLHDRDMQGAYELGKQDALKDLPKWKKMPNGIQGNGDFNPTYLVRVSNGYCFTTPCISWDKDSMYIELSELEKLPKEE